MNTTIEDLINETEKELGFYLMLSEGFLGLSNLSKVDPLNARKLYSQHLRYSSFAIECRKLLNKLRNEE